MVTTITYDNKVAINENPNIPDVNKVKDDDMNEIKSVVNNNAAELSNLETSVTNLGTYSTSEVNTGKKWIDGKPIYRKTIFISSLPNNTTTQYSHGISNVDRIWSNQGKTFICWSNGNSAPFPYISMGESSSSVTYSAMIELRAIGKTTFEIKTAWDRSTLSAYVTLEYTKTTD